MIYLGEPVPEAPPVLPGLQGFELLAALRAEQRRLVFMCEHLAHPLVSEGVADAVHDALDAVRCAVSLQRDLVWTAQDSDKAAQP